MYLFLLIFVIYRLSGLLWALVVKNPFANADMRHVGSIPGWGRSAGEENGNPLQYSCLENSMDRGTWKVTPMALQ